MIPGFSNFGTQDIEDKSPTSFVEVNGGSEWRFEVPFRTILFLKVTEGIAEIFGTELPVNVDIRFSGVKYAVYAPKDNGFKLEYYTTSNKDDLNSSSEEVEITEYVGEETPMEQYTKLHFALQISRMKATESNNQGIESNLRGPRVLIVGNQNSGKTSLAKLLVSYASKMDSMPILVNLNPRDGVFSLPGSLTATPINDRLDLESVGGWGGSTTSGTLFHNPKQPIVKSYGFSNYQANKELYKYQVSKLGIAVMSRMEEDLLVKNSGLIIDTPSFSNKDFGLIENIVSDFEVNIIVVVGNERMLIDLKKKLKHKTLNSSIDFVKVNKSGGVVDVDEAFIRKIQEETIKQYFNGTFRNILSPFKTELDVKDFVFYSAVESKNVNSSLQFLASSDSFEPSEFEESELAKKDDLNLNEYCTLIEEPSSSILDNTIVAITQLPQHNFSPKELLNTCVMGYAHISKYDDIKGRIKVLLPYQGTVPRNTIVVTGIRYIE